MLSVEQTAQFLAGKSVCCIGGGHGLSSVLKSLKSTGCDLTGIVATTDNGGSSGKLRESVETIAWGDLRHCLGKLSDERSIEKLLFDFRFECDGELNGHSLGNLMLLALEQLCPSPTDCLNIMKKFLNIDANILPMSDEPTTLCANTQGGLTIEGETSIDLDHSIIEDVFLSPSVNLTDDVNRSIAKADIIVLGPGSFLTSVIPPLLVNDMIDLINVSSAKLIFIDNLSPEQNEKGRFNTLEEKIKLLNDLGLRDIDVIIGDTNSHALSEQVMPFYYITEPFMQSSVNGCHHPSMLAQAFTQLST